MSSWLNQTFHAPLHAIGKMAITFVWQLVQFQINNHFIPYEPAISVAKPCFNTVEEVFC